MDSVNRIVVEQPDGGGLGSGGRVGGIWRERTKAGWVEHVPATAVTDWTGLLCVVHS